MSRLNAQQLRRPIWPYRINTRSDQARGLMAWFPFTGDTGYADLTGGRLPASSSSSRPRHTTGPAGLSALEFASASSQFLTTPTTRFLFGDAIPFSVAFWLRYTGTGAQVVASPFVFGAAAGWAIKLNDIAAGTVDLVLASAGASARIAYAGSGLNDGNWHHIVVTYSGSASNTGMAFYIDGRVATPTLFSNNAPGAFNATTCYIGSAGGTAQYLNGALADLRIHDRALSAADAFALYDPASRYDLYWMPWLAQPSVADSSQTVNPGFLASAAQLFAPTLTPGEVIVNPGFLASAAAVYAPSLTPGEVTVSPAFISSGAQLYAPTLSFDQTVSPGFISSGAQLFAPTVTNFTRNEARTWTIPADDRNWIIPSN